MEATGDGVAGELGEKLEPPSAQRPMGINGQREELVFPRMVCVLQLFGPSSAGDRIPSLGGTLSWV
eukprot:SM000041S15560  [mRNA]  locus=s41:756524:756721:- [translate_table: standard]